MSPIICHVTDLIPICELKLLLSWNAYLNLETIKYIILVGPSDPSNFFPLENISKIVKIDPKKILVTRLVESARPMSALSKNITIWPWLASKIIYNPAILNVLFILLNPAILFKKSRKEKRKITKLFLCFWERGKYLSNFSYTLWILNSEVLKF